jgi:hypothetical protein
MALPQNVSSGVQFLDPYTEEQSRLLMQEARTAAQNPINIPRQQVAGFNADQTQAFDMARSGLGNYQPGLDRAQGLYGQAAGQYGQQGAAIGEGLGLTRQAIDPTSEALGISRDALQYGQQGLGAYQSAVGAPGQTARGLLSDSVSGYNPSGVGGVSDYLNPYTQNVIDASISDINRQSGIASNDLNAQAVQAGAFGGSRGAIQQAELERNTAEQRNRVIAGLNSQNYSQALGASMGEFGRARGAEQAAGMGLAGIGAQEQGVYSQLGQNQASIGQGIAGIGEQYGRIGGQVAGIGGQYGNIAAGQTGLGGQEASLGSLQRSLGAEDVNLIGTVGGIQREQSQANLDADYQQNLQNAYEPYQRVSFVSDIFRGTPSGSQTLSVASAPTVNPFTQSLGAGIAGAQLFAPSDK